ncbi:MAG: malate synthase, partial [Nitrososphaerota archaeon]
GKITPWIGPKEEVETAETLFSSRIWGDKDLWHGLYDPPSGDITVEHIQHAFYMAANYGFQVLNGNLAAAIDDYELRQRFMNDLATYRIFVSWLWTLVRHRAKITKPGHLKAPSLTEIGVIPAIDRVRVEAETVFSEELFDSLWELHNEWVEAFYEEQDRLAATRIVSGVLGAGAVCRELLERLLPVIRRAYEAGPFRNLPVEEAAKEAAEILNTDPGTAQREIESNAPRFDRSKAPIIMEVLRRQLTSLRYIQHSARLLFVMASMSADEGKSLLEAVFAPSRSGVVEKVKRGLLDKRHLELHDYIYDYRPIGV